MEVRFVVGEGILPNSRVGLYNATKRGISYIYACVCARGVQVTYAWEIYLFAGTNPADKITLRSRRGSLELHVDVKYTPEKKPPSKTNDNIDTSLDGFFTLSSFSIDRARVRFDWKSPFGTCNT